MMKLYTKMLIFFATIMPNQQIEKGSYFKTKLNSKEILWNKANNKLKLIYLLTKHLRKYFIFQYTTQYISCQLFKLKIIALLK